MRQGDGYIRGDVGFIWSAAYMERMSEDHIQQPERRAVKSDSYPWYDSIWLQKYDRATAIIRKVRPDALTDFVNAFRVFHTRSDFEVKLLQRPFDDATLEAIRVTVKSLRPTDLELHEARSFGRFVVHDHPLLTELQQRAVPLVSGVVGEPVEANYNFLSLYTKMGICPVHMDAPQAKWTLDLCIDQSGPWPIHIGPVQPWPNAEPKAWHGEDWEDKLKRSQRFNAYTLQPGQAVVFSGSSQWHYRDAMPDSSGQQFCTQLFFHFVPGSTRQLVRPENWANLFGIPDLSEVAG